MELKNTYITNEDKFLQFNFWVTTYCNFNCRYCYETCDKPDAYMSQEIADKAIEFMYNEIDTHACNALWINFHGGEPMLNQKLIVYVVKKIKQERPDIKLFTTATTNCSVMCEEAAECISELTVSLDGTKKCHDMNRVRHDGSGTYDLAVSNALKYLELKGNVRTRMVVTPDNAANLSDNIIHLIELGFREIMPGIDHFSKEWTEELFGTVYQELLKVREYRLAHPEYRIKIGIIDSAIKRLGKCYVGCDGYQIYINGKLYPCTYAAGDEYYEVGDIFNGVDVNAAKRINCMNNGKLEACAGCGYYEYCISPRCRIINQKLTGDHMTPSAVVCASENLKIKLHGIK